MGAVKYRQQDGFTLLELIVSAAVLSIIVVAITQLFASNMLSLALGKSRATALALATEKMEYLRDLPYDSLATRNGTIVPAGTILDDEYVTRNNVRFRIHITISFVDDPFDGNLDGTIPAKPKDFYPYDYKQAEVTVYQVNGNGKMASLTTNIGAKAAETATNTGILRIKVLDANGLPIQDADIQVTNSGSLIAPIITTTDINGLVVIPKLPLDSGHRYQVAVSKTGYSSEQTYPDPAGTQVPVNVNPNILAQQISDITLSIDRTSSLALNVVDTSGNPLPNLALTITGAKKTMTNPNVFKYTQARTTDAGGNITLSGVEWDSYGVTVPAGYRIASTSPYQPITVDPGGTTSATLVLTTNSAWPQITKVTPNSDTADGTVAVTITGVSLSGSVKLTKAGQPDIAGTSISFSGSTTMNATFNISGVATGAWDLVLTSSGGLVTTQTGGFNVTNP